MEKELPLFGIYEKALKPQSFDKMFFDAKECGYDSFELSIDSTDERLSRLDWGTHETCKVLRAAQNNDMKILTTCLSGHKRYPLGSTEPSIVKTGMEIMRKAVALSGELGIRVIQISGFDVFDRESRTELTQKRYIENLFECVKIAERACVTLAIEPVEGNLLAVRDTMEVVHQINSCWLQIYPDVANINSLGIDPIAELPYGKGHIVAAHIRDSIMGDFDATIPFGTGCLNFEGVFRKLDELKFCGPLVVEMWNTERKDYRKYITQAREYMADCIRKVRKNDV